MWVPTEAGARQTNLARFMAAWQVRIINHTPASLVQRTDLPLPADVCSTWSVRGSRNAYSQMHWADGRSVDAQGNSEWRRQRAGSLAEDYELLQRISWEDPEAFWPGVLDRLHIRFARQPAR